MGHGDQLDGVALFFILFFSFSCSLIGIGGPTQDFVFFLLNSFILFKRLARGYGVGRTG